MDSYRELLNLKSPELYTAFTNLLKYLEIAILPSMASKGESLNSLPHLKDNENYLNGLIPISEELFDTNKSPFLSTYELFSILAAVYLHDIGRINCENGHGTKSKELLMKDRLWKEFGIPTKELANAIAMICEIHEPGYKKNEKNPELDLYINNDDFYIDITDKSEIFEENKFDLHS